MKIYAENENGSKVELREINLAGDGDIVISSGSGNVP